MMRPRYQIPMLIGMLTLLISTESFSQLNTNATALEMAQKLMGQNTLITNAVLDCDAPAAGNYTIATGTGIDDGVILSTSNATQIFNGGNISGTGASLSIDLASGGDFTGVGADPDLESTVGIGNVRDHCVLEFDFSSSCDSFFIEYVFASEEYPDYVCADYNDAFGFFLTGINPAGGNYNSDNIAVIPGTNTPVTINNLNNGVIGNAGNAANECIINTDPEFDASLFVDNWTAPLDPTVLIEFNGFTIPLIASRKIEPAQVYHLKLAVGDVFDGQYDSGVFFKENDADCQNLISVVPVVTDGAEKCQNASFYIQRNGFVTANDTVMLVIGGTATTGLDYTDFDTMLIFTTTLDSIFVEIPVLPDNLVEGTETIEIQVYHLGLLAGVININIADDFNVILNQSDSVCLGYFDNGSTYNLTTTGNYSGSTIAHSWEHNGNPLVNTASSWSASDTGSYIVNVDVDGCLNSDSIHIAYYEDFTTTITADTAVCAGEMLQLNASGGNSYVWIQGGTSLSSTTIADPIATVAAATVYIVEVESADGCKKTDTVSIGINANINFTFTTPDTLCYHASALDLSVLMTPVGGDYSGNGISGTNGETFLASNAGEGGHTITYDYTSPEGCTGDTSFRMVVEDLVNFTINVPDTLCAGAANVDLSAVISPIGGLYSGTGTSGVNGITFSPTDAEPGTHVISYDLTTEAGCAYDTSFNLVIEDYITFTIVPIDTLCSEANPIDLSIGVTPSGGIFSGTGTSGGGGASFTAITAGDGTHTIGYEYTTSVGCLYDTTFDITVENVLSLTIDHPGDLCLNVDALDLSAVVSPMGGAYTGTGTSGVDGLIFDPSTATVGNHVIAYSYTSAAGCSGDTTFSIAVHGLPVLTVDHLDTVCIGSTALALDNVLPVGGEYAILDVVRTTFDPVLAGSHTVDYTYTDSNSCENSLSFDMEVNALPELTFADVDPTCASKDSLVLAFASPIGGTYSGVGVTGTDFNLAVGTQTVLYDYTDANACRNTDTKVIEVISAIDPFIELNDIVAVCDGDEISISVNQVTLNPTNNTSTHSYEWFIISELDTSSVHGPAVDLYYNSGTLTDSNGVFVTLRLGNGCYTIEHTDSDIQIPVINPLINASISAPDTIICIGESTIIEASDLNGNSSVNWTWTDGSGTVVGNGSALSISTGGQYSLSGISSNNCTGGGDQIGILLVDPDVLIVANGGINDGENLVYVEQGNQITLSANHNHSATLYENYDWFGNNVSGDTYSVNFDPQISGYYTVSTDIYGCPISDEIEVRIIEPVLINHVLTANGNGQLDYWIVSGIASYPNSKVSIYNKWGGIVYESYDYESEPWTGINQRTGKELPEGVYFYTIEVSVPSVLEGTVETLATGNVTLLR